MSYMCKICYLFYNSNKNIYILPQLLYCFYLSFIACVHCFIYICHKEEIICIVLACQCMIWNIFEKCLMIYYLLNIKLIFMSKTYKQKLNLPLNLYQLWK